MMHVINPATGQLIREIPEDQESSLTEKLSSLRGAQPLWAKTPLSERIEILARFSSLLEKQKEQLAGVLTDEVGKPLSQSRNELNGARSRINWMLANASKYLAEETMVEEPGLIEKIIYEPLGVVCNISAWNYPYLVGVNVFIPALLAGNAVLYKPSEFATLTGLEIGRLFEEAGLPQHLFIVATGGREVGELLLEQTFDGYFFTGSYNTGKSIYEKVALKMVPCQCELGGKDPLYVTDDVEDIKSVAAATADGAFYNNGQSCCSVERIYVHEKIYDVYVDEFIKEVKSWKVGNPREDGIYIGPLTRKVQIHVLEEQIANAVEKGAKIRTGGKPVASKGNFFEPTVLTDVNHSMSVMHNESFGPIIGIMKVKGDVEAVQLMQDSEYGLTASVYSKQKGRAERILEQVNAGSGYWNCCDRVSAALPWSGRLHSGFGTTLSHAGIRAFTKPKAYHLRG